MQEFVKEGDGIIFLLQEAEFPRRTFAGSHMCDGQSISGIEIIEILRISCNVGSRHRVLPYSPGKLTRFLYLERIGSFSMGNGFQIMKELMPKVKGKADGKEVNQILAGMMK